MLDVLNKIDAVSSKTLKTFEKAFWRFDSF